ncbi:hypothetical protein ACQKDD_13250 [Planococcus kocurii]|uniref:hypothetical protein n=1 Tax=Planococcus kocurii TaxID=1374 RepID=UPI003CFF9CE2
MDAHSKSRSDTEADIPKEITVQKVLNLYGIFLFLGLILSIFTHGIEDINGFLIFILISSVLYFFMLNLYFVSGFGRKVVFGMIGAIALFSLFMVFYLQINPAAH